MSERQYQPGLGKPSQFSVSVSDDPTALKCVVCYHHCVLEEGHRGICGIRHNHGGTLYSLVDSMPCSVHLDPIEKKPLYHFYPGTRIFSIGTVGCNMRCSFCQNWQTSQAPKGSLDLEDVAERLYARRSLTPEAAVQRAVSHGCNSIAYTYNEPTIFADFIFDTARLAHSRGIKNVLVTNGYQSIEFIERIGPFIDACNIDLKTIRNEFYSRLCGTRIQPILRNIRIWRSLGVWVEVTTLLIPNENDSAEELNDLVDYLVDVDPAIVWHVSSYHDSFRMQGKGRTPLSALKRAHQIGKTKGLKYIYLGNVHNMDTSTTWCPACNHKLITRSDWGRGGRFTGLDRTTGCCQSCGEVVPGVWTDDCVNRYVPARTHTILPELLEIPIVPLLTHPTLPTVRVLFATQTGVSEEISRSLAFEGRNRGIDAVQVIDMEQYDESRSLPNEQVVVFVLSTFFYGRIPRNGDRLLRYLRGPATGPRADDPDSDNDISMMDEDADAPSRDLSGVRYALFGIGSTGNKPEHLETYQVIAREMDGLVTGLGAVALCQRGEGNKKDRFRETCEEWISGFWDSYQSWVQGMGH